MTGRSDGMSAELVSVTMLSDQRCGCARSVETWLNMGEEQATRPIAQIDTSGGAAARLVDGATHAQVSLTSGQRCRLLAALCVVFAQLIVNDWAAGRACDSLCVVVALECCGRQVGNQQWRCVVRRMCCQPVCAYCQSSSPEHCPANTATVSACNQVSG